MRLRCSSRSTPPPGCRCIRQIYERLREAILSGRLAAGARLPSTRTLAAELGVARNTVVLAFDQLYAEGYLAGRRGAGTRVQARVPDPMLATARFSARAVDQRPARTSATPTSVRSGSARASARAAPALATNWSERWRGPPTGGGRGSGSRELSTRCRSRSASLRSMCFQSAPGRDSLRASGGGEGCLSDTRHQPATSHCVRRLRHM